MITKEEFLKSIKVLKEQHDYEENFERHMAEALPGSYAPVYEDALWGLSVHLLETVCEDRFGSIDWWVWETDFGKEHANVSWSAEDGTECHMTVDTPEKLYEYLQITATWPDPETPKLLFVTIDLEDPDDYLHEHYLATVNDIPEIKADGHTMKEVNLSIRQAVDKYIDDLKKTGQPIPECILDAEISLQLTSNAMMREMVKGFMRKNN
ncbi:MAG: hypothetical protein MJY96_09175 [Bacteroidaceae bacterium]|nr:hypothetical protein [Bacteroidaceae bacterium]